MTSLDTTQGLERDDARRAVQGGAAPRRFGAWYVAEHRLLAMKGYAGDALFQSLGNPLIYLFALGVGLASLVPQGVGGVTYLQFVAPALMATAAMTVAANETSYPSSPASSGTRSSSASTPRRSRRGRSCRACSSRSPSGRSSRSRSTSA